MNPAQILFHQPWVARLGWTLLHFLWQGALVAALLAAVRAFAGRALNAPSRYIAACVALAAMVVAPLVTFLALSNPGGAQLPAALGTAVPASLDGGRAAASLPLASIWEWISPRLGAAWLLGVLVCSLRLLGGWLSAARLRSANTRPSPPEWQPKLQRLMARVGVTRPVLLRVSSLVEAPGVIGWLRPVILVPVGVLAGLPAAHMEALLAHELAHIRRHDYLVNLLQSLAEAVLFYHPAVWWVSRQIRAEREHCCDDVAVAVTGGDILTYARALADLESCRPAHLHAMAATGGSLRDRIRRLVDPARPAPHTLPAGGTAWALSAVLLIGIAAVACALPAQDPVVDRQAIWSDTVKQGDLKIAVRGLGILTSATAAEVKVAQQQSVEVAAGQPVEIAFQGRKETIACRLQGVRPGVTNGTVTVDVAVLAPLPPQVNVGHAVDAIITIGEISNVAYVGRPVFGNANTEVSLFKIEPDGQHATKVKVQLGRSSVNQIAIQSGLQPGDKIILSDMSAYSNYDRITLK